MTNQLPEREDPARLPAYLHRDVTLTSRVRPTADRINPLAITSLAASVASFIFLPVVGALAGVITGHIAMRQIRASKDRGRALALWGTILGYIHLALGLLAGIFLLVVVVLGVGFAASHSQQVQDCVKAAQHDTTSGISSDCNALVNPSQ